MTTDDAMLLLHGVTTSPRASSPLLTDAGTSEADTGEPEAVIPGAEEGIVVLVVVVAVPGEALLERAVFSLCVDATVRSSPTGWLYQEPLAQPFLS